jgi:hypothetical protein
MNYWERLIDVYESWDFDSLCDEAYELSCAVRDDIRRNCNVKDPLYAAIMVGVYFMDADGFADGAEVSLFRNLFEDQPIDLGGDRFLAEYRRYNWQPWVESYLRNCSKSALEAALRFGMVICASDGFIRDEERERILRWT